MADNLKRTQSSGGNSTTNSSNSPAGQSPTPITPGARMERKPSWHENALFRRPSMQNRPSLAMSVSDVSTPPVTSGPPSPTDVDLLTIEEVFTHWHVREILGAAFTSVVEEIQKEVPTDCDAKTKREALCNKSQKYRETALERLKDVARSRGGNAVIGVKVEYSPSLEMDGHRYYEWVASGTVVTLQKRPQFARLDSR
ncbi:hypothetical protein E3Q22_00625 [Wallemia mellicola]|uniref:Heavy metal-binding domain-containing protein n=2 Tax=Wallemia mellicola TaxID=1708541 RepID=A0A4T0MFY2_9BASI|nr:hypothetical protein WALSEDRAFT_31682 [Wallemia mellicola CBS 633.66]TIB68645.1 hypothetical protein E3Q24_03617 [Wallemia mellicola]EIM23045.1 hypothetical protein WALSEDRAFT_31682 [Wallemia mellicola CBS 633.66]TIB71936.1 hypothetical protein E3Q23_03602 [Wallemia mellicola]TIB81857.1 hypothetical protein E3Q22_00625 [Wallemia mellicola]TIB85405.1 hypothetical protein E3Q21_01964 [Wallemia mellicola]|eukprot:XP_006957081.1 hypothetical protein WALSEDRAFT_31682 [Wallemia mellicola CBS 633.66]